MTRTEISKDPSGRIIVSSPHDPVLVSKAKTLEGRRWRLVKKFGIFRSYTRVSTEGIGKVRSPLDNLNLKEDGNV
jgi:hypothetical protein